MHRTQPSIYQAYTARRFIGIIIAAITIVCSVTAQRGSPVYESWQQLERELDTSSLPITFVDSLRSALETPEQLGRKTEAFAAPPVPEKIVLEASWGPFRAGYGILAYEPDSVSRRATVSLAVVTNDFISSLFRVRNFLRTVIDLNGLYPVIAEERIEEGKYRARRWALFDNERGLVFSGSRKRPQVEAPPFTNDLLSLQFRARFRSVQPGDTFSEFCYVQGHVYDVLFTCTGQERVETPLGVFDCIILEPRLTGNGRNFSRRDRVRLWISKDERRILVKVKAKVSFGAISGDIVYYERANDILTRKK